MFFLLYKHTDDVRCFWKFSEDFCHFPKISKNSPKFVQRSHECCWTFPKFLKIFNEDLNMFWSYTNKFKCNFDTSEIINIFRGYGKYTTQVLDVVLVWILQVVYFPVNWTRSYIITCDIRNSCTCMLLLRIVCTGEFCFLCLKGDACFLQLQLQMDQLKINDWTPHQWISFWQWVVQF